MEHVHYDRVLDSITIRDLNVKGKLLITTLVSPNAYPKNELNALYKNRWHVEVDLRNIKTTLGMETLDRKSVV